MPIPRVPEPELMDSETEADDYDRMDFTAVNDRFVQDARAFLGAPPSVLDVGTGTGRIPLAYARAVPFERLVAVDAAPAMLARAEQNRDLGAGGARVVFALGDATRLPFVDGSFAAVFSNSLVHHLPDPIPFFREAARVVRAGGGLFVRDLARPDSVERVEEQTEAYAGIPADATDADRPRYARQRALFHASLHAAFTVDEVAAMAERAELRGATVAMTSDRHWTMTWRRP